MKNFDNNDMTTQIGVAGLGLIIMLVGFVFKFGFFFRVLRFAGFVMLVYGIFNIVRINKNQQ